MANSENKRKLAIWLKWKFFHIGIIHIAVRGYLLQRYICACVHFIWYTCNGVFSCKNINNDLNGLNSRADAFGAAGGCCGTCTITFGTFNGHTGLYYFAFLIHCMWVWICAKGLLETSGVHLVCVWSVTGFTKRKSNILIVVYRQYFFSLKYWNFRNNSIRRLLFLYT